ncbi:hypothetical protein CHS0354_032616 [Potamilus streckersoni]|uniref:Neuronal acetylcholine receptor subunit alpha-7 n=1 Tax=Potamilus streckersoni TaxID=2493646 RepID=A0AAE0T926_9BIVA|nr:hypothetical protein CHS0354_032616 [Potamilus streckersoni]
MYNSADEAFDGTYHTNVIVDHQGNTLWVPPGMFKSTCAIDITWFPFDDQKCSLKFGSWTYDGRFIDLYMDNEAGGDTTTFIRNGEWDLTGVPGVKNVKTYQCCPERYIDITYTIHIRRRTLYYGFNIIIPCLLISSMSLLLFMLPPDAGEKISLGVTILLSLMVFLLLVAETMPPTSDALPLIGIYFCCIMIMCSLSVLCTVIVLNYHHRGPETHKLPQWVKRGINGWLAYALRMKRPETDKRKQSIIHRDRLGDIHMNERTTHTLLPNLLELEEEVHASPAAENGICGVPSFTRDEWLGNVSCDNSSKVTDCSVACERRYMMTILKEIRKITGKLKREEEDSDIKNEWKFAALVIDRLCFWICLTFTLTSTLTILFSAPHLVA